MTSIKDPFKLKRFVDAQEQDYSWASYELSIGQKRGHWIWYIFPQMKGLGLSEMSNYYGISSLQEAEAYLAHPVLGPRLRECTQLLAGLEGRSVDEIFGYPDNLKFRSSMTLFAATKSDNQIFKDALKKYFGGQPDPITMGLLASS